MERYVPFMFKEVDSEAVTGAEKLYLNGQENMRKLEESTLLVLQKND